MGQAGARGKQGKPGPPGDGDGAKGLKGEPGPEGRYMADCSHHSMAIDSQACQKVRCVIDTVAGGATINSDYYISQQGCDMMGGR